MVKSQNDKCSSAGGSKAFAATPRVSRRERRAAETRIKLFRSALALIAERDLANVTVEDITEAADVGKGTIFTTSQLKSTCSESWPRVSLESCKRPRRELSRAMNPLHPELHRLGQRLAEEPGRSPGPARALISSFLGNESVRQILKRNMALGLKFIAEVVRIGQERAEIDRSLKKGVVAMQLLQMTLGAVLLWSLHEKPALSNWIENCFNHAWRAIAAPGT
jgi:hypothetical protein